jgi:hypothetical protein
MLAQRFMTIAQLHECHLKARTPIFEPTLNLLFACPPPLPPQAVEARRSLEQRDVRAVSLLVSLLTGREEPLFLSLSVSLLTPDGFCVRWVSTRALPPAPSSANCGPSTASTVTL